MARQRRGGGFKPPELPLRGTLGTLLRTAAAQVGPLRDALGDALGDALERTAREGRSRLDDARSRFDGSRSSRRRTDALADLGEIVLDLIRRGEIDLAELPEVTDLVTHLDELDAGGADDDSGADALPHDRDHDQPPARPPARNRFDSRGRDSRNVPPPSARPAPAPRRGAAGRSNDDGTTSSRTWAPPTRPVGKPAPRVWRPPIAEAAGPPADEVTSRPRRADPLKQGGISFEDDDDLDEYMHPDDVPPKKPSDSDP